MTAKYYAQITAGKVTRVLVCNDPAWLASALGGTWVETLIDSDDEQYAGIDYGLEIDHPRKFAPQWTQPTGSEDAYPIGSWAWLDGRIYQSTTPANVWQPGVFGWRDKTDIIPQWRQPLGAGDEWKLNDEVLHAAKHWKSLNAANVWEPGAVGSEALWLDITELAPPAEIPDWAPGQVVIVGDLRMYLGTAYRCKQAHTTQAGWTPPAVPALWEIAT